jgi:hypothetical protein
LQSENGLSGARTTHQKRGTAARQASAGNFIKTGDARGRFGGHVHGPRSDEFHIVSFTPRFRTAAAIHDACRYDSASKE